MPRWVKVSLLALAALAMILGAALVSGGHGPSRHGAWATVGLPAHGGFGA
jgi:hypothetical protein